METNHFKKSIERFMDEQGVHRIVKEFDFKHGAKVYIGSGQMFNLFGRMGLELLADICEAVRLDYYLPQHNMSINDKGTVSDITNEMIFEGDVAELNSCNFMFSHFTIPEDSGLSAECGYFGHMRKVSPSFYWGSVAMLDDIRKETTPNPGQRGVDNQVIYMNSFTAGIPDYFGETLYNCFAYMYERYCKESLQK